MEKFIEFAANHPYLILAAVGLLMLIIVNEIRLHQQGGSGVSPAQLVALINQGAVVLDVRSAELFAKGHIVDATNMPADNLPDGIDKIKKAKKKPVITCCDAGVASSRAATVLRKAGYENVFALKGGLQAWQRENLPTVTGK